MRRIWSVTGIALAMCAGGAPTRTLSQPPTLVELMRRASVIKPSAGELKWQRIPWLLDLGKAQRAALEEHRPLLVWATGDDPLERC